jgi:ABC-type molybdate transport system substrate-binding protein
VAVVKASTHRATARAFVAKLLRPWAQSKLRAAGFLANG